MRINKIWLLIALIIFLCSLPLNAQNTDNYMEQGGARWVVGGELDIISGGEMDIESGGAWKIAGTAVTASADELNVLGGIEADVDELNILHGVTATTEDINTLTGTASQFIVYQVEDLAADGDISARELFVCPSGFTFTLSSINIISQGSATGIDDTHTCVIAALNGTDSIVSKTYDLDPAFPADGVADDLGSLNATHKVIEAGEILKFSITNGTNANPPAFIFQVVGTLETVE